MVPKDSASCMWTKSAEMGTIPTLQVRKPRLLAVKDLAEEPLNVALK